MWKRVKALWGVLTGNMVVGYLSIGSLPNGNINIIFSSYKPRYGEKVDYSKSIILPEGSIVYMPTLTEGRIETPEEWKKRTEGGEKS